MSIAERGEHRTSRGAKPSVILLCLLLVSAPWVAKAAPVPSADDLAVRGPFLSAPVSAVRFDADLRTLPQVAGPQQEEEPLPLREPFLLAPRLEQADPVAQTWVGNGTGLTQPGANFAGLDHNNWGAGYPPDTNGDVGPAHYIQTVNSSFGIFDKNTGEMLFATRYRPFFAGVPPCDTYSLSDPVALYDALADRWLVSILGYRGTNNPSYMCIGISQTSDPVAGGWYFYAFPVSSGLYDYPKIGVWPDAYYMTGNVFSPGFSGYRVWALDRNAMLQGGNFTGVGFDVPPRVTEALIAPSNLRGNLPPDGSPDFFVSVRRGAPQSLNIWKFTVDFIAPENSTFTGPTVVGVASFNAALPVHQPGTSQRLDTLGDRLMVQVQYRNIGGVESLWANHTASDAGVDGVRWYEVRDPNGSPTLFQQGTYLPDSDNRWMGSLAVDGQGDMAVGYSVSSDTVFPSIRFAGRLVTDDPGILSQDEQSLVEGSGSQTGISRWGDYSAMTIDPTDDCTFWYTTEYYVTTGGNWQTRIGSFQFAGCGAAPASKAGSTP